MQAQRAVPMATPVASAPSPPQSVSAPVPPAAPLPAIDAPTARPLEPLTHGAAIGPGAGPEALGLRAAQTDSLAQFLAAAGMAPQATDEVRALAAQFSG